MRKADDYVDSVPQQAEAFYNFKDRYRTAMKGEETGDIVVDSFVNLIERRGFEEGWVDSFLASMEADLYVSSYDTLEDLKAYLYGSAEAVGLMMAKIMGLPPVAYGCARHLGRAMQYVNFIRDIEEDLALNRTYFPQEDLAEHGLEGLDYGLVSSRPVGFRNFIDQQILRYRDWQETAERGFVYIPRRYLIPIKTASEMYKWTARVIRQDPFIVYERKVKPSVLKIVSQIGYNTLFTYRI